MSSALQPINSLISASRLSVSNVHKIPVSIFALSLSITVINEPGQATIPLSSNKVSGVLFSRADQFAQRTFAQRIGKPAHVDERHTFSCLSHYQRGGGIQLIGHAN